MTITRSDTIRKLETQHQIFFDGRVDPQSHFGDCTWEITIDYQDIYGNIYHLHQTGKGVNSKEPTITED